jgi:hypothetical protein
MARVLKTTPLRMASDPSSGAIAHWKHGALHDVVEPMTEHVVMTYTDSVQRLERRSGRSAAIGTARPGVVTIIPAGSSARWDIYRPMNVVQLYLPQAVATAGIEAENAGFASGLFNMMRNLGGAIGIAALQTLVTKREQYHSNVLMQSVSMFEQATRARIEQLTQYFMNHGVIDRVDAMHRADVAIGKIVQKQAFILAFSDTFYVLGAALIVALLAGLLLKKPDRLDGGGGAH